MDAIDLLKNRELARTNALTYDDYKLRNKSEKLLFAAAMSAADAVLPGLATALDARGKSKIVQMNGSGKPATYDARGQPVLSFFGVQWVAGEHLNCATINVYVMSGRSVLAPEDLWPMSPIWRPGSLYRDPYGELYESLSHAQLLSYLAQW